MPNRESLYSKMPDYRVDLEPSSARVRVHFNGALIVDSSRALIVHEMKLPPVLYFPRDDIQMKHLVRTDNQTFCPFKGEASYWSLEVGERCEDNAVWSYEDPFEQVIGLKDYLAFYPDRVEWERDC